MDEAADWLAQEILDLLPVSAVGLYEFIWTLRTGYPEMSSAERYACAQQALNKLIATGRVGLIRTVWATPDAADVPIERTLLPDDAWSDPDQDGNYVAVRLQTR